jgi:hypothetical protein
LLGMSERKSLIAITQCTTPNGVRSMCGIAHPLRSLRLSKMQFLEHMILTYHAADLIFLSCLLCRFKDPDFGFKMLLEYQPCTKRFRNFVSAQEHWLECFSPWGELF